VSVGDGLVAAVDDAAPVQFSGERAHGKSGIQDRRDGCSAATDSPLQGDKVRVEAQVAREVVESGGKVRQRDGSSKSVTVA
jgi:hypothetical protein